MSSDFKNSNEGGPFDLAWLCYPKAKQDDAEDIKTMTDNIPVAPFSVPTMTQFAVALTATQTDIGLVRAHIETLQEWLSLKTALIGLQERRLKLGRAPATVIVVCDFDPGETDTVEGVSMVRSPRISEIRQKIRAVAQRES